MKELEVKFGRKAKIGDFEMATFEVTTKVQLADNQNCLAELHRIFGLLEAEIEKEIQNYKRSPKIVEAPEKPAEEWLPTKNPRYLMRILPDDKFEFKDTKDGHTWISEKGKMGGTK